jgi:signal transduction histidine kinase
MRRLLHHWVFFILGGALFTPYALCALLAVPLAVPAGWLTRAHGAVLLPVLLIGLIVGTGLLPFVRTIEASVVPVLLGGHAAGLRAAPSRTLGGRLRAVAWYAAHTIGGAVLSVATLVGLPMSLVLLTTSWTAGDHVRVGLGNWHVDHALALPLGIAIPLAVTAAVAASGRLAAWLAPVLLGPDPVARLEELERRSAELTERNRLAQELHDSLGHALTVTTLQAAAAQRLLKDDPGFAEQALDAIARTSRDAAAELDDVLRLLRDEPAGKAPQPDLRGLPALVAAHREAGLPLEVSVLGDAAELPAVVSREVYRILQEALTNVARHAGAVPARLELDLGPTAVRARLHNERPARPGRRPPRRAGGRGLSGMAERAAALGGELRSGPAGDGEWLLELSVPVGAGR